MSQEQKNITKSTESTEHAQSTTSAENTDKLNYSVEAIENTPFTTVMVEDKWIVTLGNYQISDKFSTKEEAIKDAPYRDWETDRKSTRLNSSHITRARMPSSP